jgi:pSer/pThr/pTyr-binding forkhead associated (FHA) protein/S1-C subfamily serine protease
MPFLRLRDLKSDQPLEFEQDEVRIGRDPEFELAITGEVAGVVSGNHARIVHREGGWWLEDLGSRNGTFLNDQRLAQGAPRPLAKGVVISLGTRGPRYRVLEVAKRHLEPTVPEGPLEAQHSAQTLPMGGIDSAPSEAPEPSRPEAAPALPALTVVLRHEKRRRDFRVQEGRVRIGRGKECEVRPVGSEDTSVSRVHAEIVLKPDGTAVVRDAQSRNGTFVGGERVVGERPLHVGDRLQLGPGGTELLVFRLALPGQPEVEAPRSSAKRRKEESLAGRVAEKLGAARRSFGGKGATVFLHEMFAESSRRAAKRVRWVVWTFVLLLSVAVTAMYYYSEWRMDQTATQLQEQQRVALERQQAIADSILTAANAEDQLLREELAEARASSAPAAVVESLRVTLTQAQERTAALEQALQRAETSLEEQLAAGVAAQRQAQAELDRVRQDLNRARASGSNAALDSLRQAMQAAEDRAAAIATQMRAMEGVNLAGVAQANQSAVGLVAVYVGDEIYDGSGFALTRSGFFVTNRHVLIPLGGRLPDSVYVTMADQRVMKPADVVMIATASGPDLGVLKVRGFDGPHVQEVDWSGANARQGEPAALIGFPAGFGNALDATRTVRTSMSAGIFSKVTSDVVNFDGFTVGGSSGSPIFNADGEVVAVHRAGLAEAVGMGFAVPIAQLIPLLPAEAKRELGLR